MPFDVMQICLNGHKINQSFYRHAEYNLAYCKTCGAKTIASCQKCEAPIQGHEYPADGSMIIGDDPVPSFCHECGKPYPWTESAIEATALLIQEDECINDDDKQTMKESLLDIMVESPRTKLAATRIKKGLRSATEFTVDAVREFAIQLASEATIRLLGFK